MTPVAFTFLACASSLYRRPMDQVRVEPGFCLTTSLEKGRSSWDPGCATPAGSARQSLPRKEVIQPQLPLRLPCYDFVPITSPALDGCLPEGLAHRLQALPAFVT